MTHEISGAAPVSSSWPRGRIPVACLAIVGVVVVVAQVWGYTAWLVSADFVPIRSSEPLPGEISANVARAELAAVAGAALWLSYVVWDVVRKRALTWPLLWTVAWASVFWQEPMVNLRNHTFSFNKAFVNRGDWTPHLPFVRDSSPLPPALVMEGLVFVSLLPLIAVATAGLLRVLRRHLRIPVLVVLVAWFAVAVFNMVFERWGIAQGVLSYVEVGGPAFDKGKPTQWPIYEGIALGFAWALPGMVTFFRRDALDPARRELTPRWWRGRRATLVTLLAAVGLVNLVFGLYNAGYVWILDGTVAEMPAWLEKHGAYDLK
ncbi:spirocyclase AveC family protein [Lentzea sp. NPDC051213]|uniref:spirocyclase AveC family protein n=1 Tax=Lentzea sp. NPDC051213 TaxID=3364126 RepID=UPI0037979B14